MKRILIGLTALLTMMVCRAQDVKIEFFTPNIVHVVKGTPTKSLVVIAKPGEVAVTKSGNTWKSSELTVKQDAQGNLTFLTAKGKVLLRENGWSLIRKNIDEWEVKQTFTLEVRVVDNLDISQNSLRLATFTQETLNIYGTGHYAIKVENEDVAVATQEGSTLLVKGLDVGTTDIEVTDTLTNQSKYIHVTVFFVPMFTCSNDNHPHIIDLGLPSGTQWSCCNMGAENPEARGGYYAWGETAVKDDYSWETYKHCKGKRNTCFNLGEDIAGTEHDVAHVVWRSSWRMPSEEQFRELLTNCDREWTSINGVNILRLTGPSGGTISLPLAGYIWGSEVYEDNEYADYWTSTVDESNSNYAISFGFYPPNDVRFDEGDYRYTGLSVRPVFQVSNQSEGNTANSQP